VIRIRKGDTLQSTHLEGKGKSSWRQGKRDGKRRGDPGKKIRKKQKKMLGRWTRLAFIHLI
jgi:hypothetical protein